MCDTWGAGLRARGCAGGAGRAAAAAAPSGDVAAAGPHRGQGLEEHVGRLEGSFICPLAFVSGLS